MFADKDTVTARLLSTKAFVGIGLISYSAYLWHQPLFAFARIRSIVDPSESLMLLLSVISVTLAYISWKFIEKPFRIGGFISRKVIFTVSLVGLVFFITLGLLGNFERFTVQNHSIKNNIQTSESIPVYETKCNLQNSILNANCRKIGSVTTHPSILILGDSHAAANLASIAEVLHKENKSALSIGFGGCTPIKNVALSVVKIFNKCIELNNEVYNEFLLANAFENIVLISRWTIHWQGSPFDNQEGGRETLGNLGSQISLLAVDASTTTTNKVVISALFAESIKQLSELSNLVIVYPIPEAGWNIPKAINATLNKKLTITNETLSTSSKLYDERNKPLIELFDSMQFSLSRVFPKEIFCDTYVKERCVTILDLVPLYYDDDHLSKRGSELLTEAIADKLR
tara:strand:- start:1077 stop:2279 length:1203 start_codon:yes stop_codon:yes gene_type:complete